MMIQEIEKKIKDSYYWDARVKYLECNYFGDEVKIVFEDEKKDITYFFSKCYKVLIEHDVEYIKEISPKHLTFAQIPYFMQNVEVKKVDMYQEEGMEFKINMYPIELLIVCKSFDIY